MYRQVDSWLNSPAAKPWFITDIFAFWSLWEAKLVGGWSLPLWKMMEWKSVGMMKFPIYGKLPEGSRGYFLLIPPFWWVNSLWITMNHHYEIPNWMESHKIPWFQTTNQQIYASFWTQGPKGLSFWPVSWASTKLSDHFQAGRDHMAPVINESQ